MKTGGKEVYDDPDYIEALPIKPVLIMNQDRDKNRTVNIMRVVLAKNLNIDPMKSTMIPDIKRL